MPSIHCNYITNINWDYERLNNDELKLVGDVDIWKIPISSNLKLISKFSDILSGKEQRRAERYHQQKDKDRFILSRIALRILIGKYSGIPPHTIIFAEGINKKPFAENINLKNFQYNLSHAENFIVIAFSKSEIGIDIEKVDKNFSFKEILEQNFSDGEIAFIKNSNASSDNFYLLWTRKEALLKATSKGIDDNLKLVPCLNGANLLDEEIIGSHKDWFVSSFKVENDYIASIAYKASNQAIAFRDINLIAF
jgi:4'-phosphopantetheinyl transferase